MNSARLKKLGIELPDTEVQAFELLSGTYSGKYENLNRKTLQRISLLREIISEYNQHSQSPERPLTCSSMAAEYMRPVFLGLNHEESWAVFTNGRGRPIKKLLISSGSTSSTQLNQKRIAKEAVLSGAVSIILYHNHPSGDPIPSDSDRKTTESLRDALELFDIRLIDHIIISSAGERFYSFADEHISEFHTSSETYQK